MANQGDVVVLGTIACGAAAAPAGATGAKTITTSTSLPPATADEPTL